LAVEISDSIRFDGLSICTCTYFFFFHFSVTFWSKVFQKLN
jgi:hypothetical protein